MLVFRKKNRIAPDGLLFPRTSRKGAEAQRKEELNIPFFGEVALIQGICIIISLIVKAGRIPAQSCRGHRRSRRFPGKGQSQHHTNG